ncbi:AhpC/TSA family protein [bacterium A37T11]|nr:AhpC/TSA family protein [bacterium A37T11]
MKQILRLGERYGLLPIKRHILYTLLISLYILLLPTGFARAQSVSVKDLGIPEGGLKIGDTIPEALWHLPLQVVNHPEGKDTITLNDYRGKLIILDFWATHCLPCIGSLKSLDILQKQFNTNLRVLPVSEEDPTVIRQFLGQHNWRLPSLANQTLLKKYFPFLYIPHQVWIHGKTVMAITDHKSADSLHIATIINGGDIKLKPKTDVLFKGWEPTDQYIKERGKPFIMHSVLSEYLEGLGGTAITSNDSLNICYFNNFPIMQMIVLTLRVPYNQVILEIKDPSRVFPMSDSRRNRYCYQLLAPKTMDKKQFRNRIVNDLCSSFGLVVSQEVRNMPCYVILESARSRPLKQLSSDMDFNTFIDLLNYREKWADNPIRFINKSVHKTDQVPGLTVNDVLGLRNNLTRLKKYLSAYGFRLVSATRPLKVTVISDASISLP